MLPIPLLSVVCLEVEEAEEKGRSQAGVGSPQADSWGLEQEGNELAVDKL